MDLEDIKKNIFSGAYNMLPYLIKEGITTEKVRSISIKTFNSISLPIYNHLT